MLLSSIFLNEPPEGGETAFPMADNVTFVKEVSYGIYSWLPDF